MEAGDGGDEALSCAAPLNLHASADRKVFAERNIYFDVTVSRWHSVRRPPQRLLLCSRSCFTLSIGGITVG